MKWTEQQLSAIKCPVQNLLVTAAAGAGKTQVLSGRIINKIIEGSNINDFLVITFTRAAAAEMRERIGREISSAISKDPENKHLGRQLTLINNSSITTIDSFCLDVVRSYFFVQDIDPNFRTADNTEIELFKLEALDICMEELYELGGDDFIALLDAYGGAKNDNAIGELIMDLHNFSQSTPWPTEWLNEMAGLYSTDNFSKTPSGRLLMKKAVAYINEAISVCTKAYKISSCDDELAKYALMFEKDIQMLECLLVIEDDWDKLYSSLCSAAFEKKPVIKGVESDNKEYCSALRDKVKALVKSAQSLICDNCENTTKLLNGMVPVINALVFAVLHFDSIFTELKQEKGVYDFSDLEHLTLKILSQPNDHNAPSDAAKEIMNRFEEIYIDEYQDANMVQETMFSLISKQHIQSPNIFMVGDMKQSIYRFRQTSPELFKSKKDSYGDNYPNRKISLALNFRSREQVINSINSVFSLLMSDDAGELDYNDDEKLYCGSDYYTYTHPSFEKTELHIIDRGDENKILEEARIVAQRITALMNEGILVYDKGASSFRPLKYMDITILMRSTKSKAVVFEQELSAASIPVFSDVGSGYYESTEIKLFLSLLQIIDNPLQDIALIAVLRSPMFGFSADELSKIRSFSDGSFYSAVLEYSKTDIPCQNFLNKLNLWRNFAEVYSVDKLITSLFNETGYFAFVGGLYNGEQRQLNLRMLLEYATRFEQTSFKGLFNFLNYIEKVKSSGDTGSPKMLSERMDVVRIMSVHKSKGLEFPVVFLCTAGTQFNLRESKGVYHKDLGIALKWVDAKRRISTNTALKEAVSLATKAESLSEEMRILYVAMTRAREKLIITGSLKDRAAALTKWEDAQPINGKISPIAVFEAKSFLDWIGMSITHSKDKLWDVQIHSPIQTNQGLEDEAYSPISKPPSIAVKERLDYIYPFKDLSKLSAKLSVSELKGQPHDNNWYLPQMIKPAFLNSEKNFTASQKGSIIHYVMQNLDFQSENIYSQLEKMIENKLILKEEIEAINLEKINVFLNSDIGKRMRAAKKLYRETDFTIELPASYISPEYPDDENVIVQGIIDCHFFEGDNIILLDYKTDVADKEEIKERYKTQIDLYALALEKKYLRKVYQKFIYLFNSCDIMLLS